MTNEDPVKRLLTVCAILRGVTGSNLVLATRTGVLMDASIQLRLISTWFRYLLRLELRTFPRSSVYLSGLDWPVGYERHV